MSETATHNYIPDQVKIAFLMNETTGYNRPFATASAPERKASTGTRNYCKTTKALARLQQQTSLAVNTNHKMED